MVGMPKTIEVMTEPDTILGDSNYDGIVNILDVILVVNMVLDGGSNLDGEINNDGNVDVLDVVNVVNIILDI